MKGKAAEKKIDILPWTAKKTQKDEYKNIDGNCHKNMKHKRKEILTSMQCSVCISMSSCIAIRVWLWIHSNIGFIENVMCRET